MKTIAEHSTFETQTNLILLDSTLWGDVGTNRNYTTRCKYTSDGILVLVLSISINYKHVMGTMLKYPRSKNWDMNDEIEYMDFVSRCLIDGIICREIDDNYPLDLHIPDDDCFFASELRRGLSE